MEEKSVKTWKFKKFLPNSSKTSILESQTFKKIMKNWEKNYKKIKNNKNLRKISRKGQKDPKMINLKSQETRFPERRIPLSNFICFSAVLVMIGHKPIQYDLHYKISK